VRGDVIRARWNLQGNRLQNWQHWEPVLNKNRFSVSYFLYSTEKLKLIIYFLKNDLTE